MGCAMEAAAATLCILGLTGALWWLLGRMLRPLPRGSAFVLLRGMGEGTGLEQTVRGFVWLRSLGVLNSPTLIADLGLNPRGREIALRLCARWPGVILWPGEDVIHYLKEHE